MGDKQTRRIELGTFVETPRVPGTITERNNQGQVMEITPDRKYCKVRIRVKGLKRQDVPFPVSQVKRVPFPDRSTKRKPREWDYGKEKPTGE